MSVINAGLLVSASAVLAMALTAPAFAQKALATAEINHHPGVVAEVLECKRADGMLSVKVRLTNKGDKTAAVYVVKNKKYDEHYVVAGKKKYLMMRDAEKKPLAASDPHPRLKKNESWTWWAKFHAPPADVTKINYFWPIGSPIENIPCTET